MFRLTRKPSSGSHSQYLAKITHSVQCEYVEVVQTLSVWPVRRVCCAHTPHRSYYDYLYVTYTTDFSLGGTDFRLFRTTPPPI